MRRRDPNRLRDIVQAAAQVFLRNGYRRTRVAGVARDLGIASGTVYLYVESKEALFDLVIRATLAPELLQRAWEWPIRTPPAGSTVEFIRAALESEAKFPALEKALRSPEKEARRELEAIVRELYRKTSQRWLALKLLERCAQDWPELAELWFGGHRLRLLQQLTRYLDRGMSAGRLRRTSDAAGAARLILEVVAAFAMHCRTDPHPGAVDQAAAEDLVVDAVVHAYQPVHR